MIKKWYIGTFITALALLVVMQQRAVVPNQEVVLEFVNIDITSPEAQNTIVAIQKQLQSIGVKNTRISRESNSGKLTITYYSDADVAYIKKVLSEKQSEALDLVFFHHNENEVPMPSDNDSMDYNLDVHKIQKSTDLSSDFLIANIVEVEIEQNSHSDNYSYNFIDVFDEKAINNLRRVAERIHIHIAIAIDNTSHNIPEVRAGPIS